VRTKDRVQFFVYRDWPDQRTHGAWAERSSKPGGTRGPAQEKTITGVDEYVRLIKKLEAGRESSAESRVPEGNPAPVLDPRPSTLDEQVCQRFGDPRSGAASAVSQEDDEGGLNFFAMLERAGMPVCPVALLSEDRFIGEGIKLINDLLDYDLDRYREEGNRFTPDNEPRLFISEDCEQVIDCLRLWTPHGPVKDQACKDFIDLLRYMAVSELDDYGRAPLISRGGGSY
jgi:hypothetical protein